MSEKEILAELKSGNQVALKMLFDNFYIELTRYALKIVGNSEVAEEIVQDIFVSIWNNREKSEIEAVRPYLSRAVKNRCINHIKKNHPIHEDIESSMHVSSNNSPLDGIEATELQKALKEAESRLPKQTALIFALSRHTELTYPEISKELDISVKTVEYHISKALKSMRGFLSESGILFIILLLLLLFK